MPDTIQIKGAFDGSAPQALLEREPAIDIDNGRLFFGGEDDDIHAFFLSNMSDQEWADYMALNYSLSNHTHSNYAQSNHTHSLGRWFNFSGRNHWRAYRSAGSATNDVPLMDTDGRVKYMHWAPGYLRFQVDATWFGVYHDVSDIRFKDNVTVLDSEDYWQRTLDAAMQLPVVEFDWNDKTPMEGHEGIGIIAQGLQQLNPELVTTDPDGYLHVNMNKVLIMLLVCIKGLNSKVEALEP